MNKDSTFQTSQSSRSLINEQKSRISQNYRAAKSLLVRKRPYDANSASKSDGDGTLSLHPRVPLAEVQNYMSSPVASMEGKLTPGAYNGCYCPRMKTACDSASPVQFHPVAENCQMTSLKMSDQSTYSGLFSWSDLLEDDLNESVLKEIDDLCKEKSSAMKERHCLSKNSSLGGQSKESDVQESTNDICRDDPETRNDLVEMEPRGNPTPFQEHGVSLLSDAYTKYLLSLNDKQKEAATSDISIPLMILAGPGSGKTSTMVGRVLTLLKEGIGSPNILAMTFTTAAASEMTDRIGTVAGKAVAKELTICTFHSFCLQLCRSHAEKLGRTPEFLIYGHGQQRRAIIEAVRLTESATKNEQVNGASEFSEGSNSVSRSAYSLKDKSKKWLKFINQAKASGKTPDEFKKIGDEIGASILQNYNDILRSCNALDYNDFVSCSVTLLTSFTEVFKECQDTWRAIVVDEFQDTSAMQYRLLQILASHSRITVIGDDDQSIFSFNGANICGFDSFKNDFTSYKEIRLSKNYRSTRCIVDAASSLIHHNVKRCHLKEATTDNLSGSKITVKECLTEEAQCAYVVDKILELTCDGSGTDCTFGNIAVLYRRQVSGKEFQTSFRNRKIPFNIHGVAFYRKKVTKAIMAILKTTLPGCDDSSFCQVFKVLLPGEKEERKEIINYINKIIRIRKCSFLLVAKDVFGAKISGTFNRSQLTQGRKVLLTLDMISNLVQSEKSISSVITSVGNLLPQKYLLEQRAVVDADGGKLLNEDSDMRSVIQYLLDDVSEFLNMHFSSMGTQGICYKEERGCINIVKAFVDYISVRESENFRSRRLDNKNSVTLTTIHQSKGLEWDTVFIVKANESEIPLLHEYNGTTKGGASLEEERRLMYVAMTRARQKLYILYVTVDSNWQILWPSRFLKEIPAHLVDKQDEMIGEDVRVKYVDFSKRSLPSNAYEASMEAHHLTIEGHENFICDSLGLDEAGSGIAFIKRFHLDHRSKISLLFHQWAKKPAFQDPKRLIDKVGFVIDERLRLRTCKYKDVLKDLKACLRSEEAFLYAKHVLRWEQIPADRRARLMKERQEHFQKQRIEHSMNSSAATSKQIAYLQSLGCTITPSSRLHASHLIEQYKLL